MKRLLKSAIEKMANNRVWLEQPSNLDDVRRLMRKLSPINIKTPLIRLGAKNDGGYLIPDDLDGIDACISPGVSDEIGFDLALANRGIDVFMVDASVASPPVTHPRFHFQPKFLDVVNDEKSIRLDALYNSIGTTLTQDKLLQMDIEGAEYNVLLDASEDVLSQFRIIIVEFHSLDRMFSSFPLKLIEATFKKLLRSHTVVHAHPNNICTPTVRAGISIPPVMEFTWYRNDRIQPAQRARARFPHPLDADNCPDRPHVALPECWT